jgi:hypothetical protein
LPALKYLTLITLFGIAQPIVTPTTHSKRRAMERLAPGHRNLESEGRLTCSCGRSFSQQNALSKHQRSCTRSKKRLAGAIDKAKSAWEGRKRRRLDPSFEFAAKIKPSSAGLTAVPSQPDENIAEYEVYINACRSRCGDLTSVVHSILSEKQNRMTRILR